MGLQAKLSTCLLIYAQNRDFDPSELAGTFGENGQFPGTRSIGFNLKLQF